MLHYCHERRGADENLPDLAPMQRWFRLRRNGFKTYPHRSLAGIDQVYSYCPPIDPGSSQHRGGNKKQETRVVMNISFPIIPG